VSFRKIRLTDHRGRDAVVSLEACRVADDIRYRSAAGAVVRHVRLVKSSATISHESLLDRFGDQQGLAKALVAGDPEMDIEAVGKRTGPCKRVFVDGKGEPLYTAKIVEVVYGPDGLEKERREPKSCPSNLLDPRPWSRKLLPREVATRRFAFTRKYLVRHVDALTFDFLFSLASYLESKASLVVIASGAKGTGPFILERNGAPMLGLIEGRTEGDGYLLILHLAAFELRQPPKAAP
jgi:hypothetical protein